MNENKTTQLQDSNEPVAWVDFNIKDGVPVLLDYKWGLEAQEFGVRIPLYTSTQDQSSYIRKLELENSILKIELDASKEFCKNKLTKEEVIEALYFDTPLYKTTQIDAEPVAWIIRDENGYSELDWGSSPWAKTNVPLYTKPQTKLCDEEILDLFNPKCDVEISDDELIKYARAIEAELLSQ